jgi:hypothetical protein
LAILSLVVSINSIRYLQVVDNLKLAKNIIVGILTLIVKSNFKIKWKEYFPIVSNPYQKVRVLDHKRPDYD